MPDFRVGDAIQRLRWIMPGEFLMGSPASEAEHWDNETHHRVILTQGYWLADTACTQALWQAVLGDSPSRFKGEDRPVETVNWDGAQRFIARLNELGCVDVHLSISRDEILSKIISLKTIC